MKDRPLWLRTPEASAWLGCSSQYLKKNRDLNDGPLEEGIHYVFGASLNSPIRWEVHSIKETFYIWCFPKIHNRCPIHSYA